MVEKRVYSPQEVAEALTVSTKTVYKMLHQKQLPYIKAGDKYLIPVAALDLYLVNASGKA